MFEDEYKRWARHPDYQSLFSEVDLATAADEVHNGYFSIDKKKVAGKTVEMVKDTRLPQEFGAGHHQIGLRARGLRLIH